MITFIQGLITLGKLNSQSGAELISELPDVQVDLSHEHANLAIVELKNSILHIKISISLGMLSSTNGQTLINAATDIINALNDQIR